MITRESATPLYQQIEKHFIHAIMSGELLTHSRLPSERELMKKWGVSRITVRQALNELILRGFIYSAPGKGFFVADQQERANEFAALLSFSEAARIHGQRPHSRVLAAHLIPPSPALMQQLLLPADADIVEIVRVRYLDDVPVGIQKNWLPHSLCQDILTHDFADTSLYSILREQYGHILAQARMTISARLADREEVELLDLQGKDPVLTVDQLTFDREQRPIEVSLGIFHPQRYPLSVIQGRSGS